MIMLNGNKIKIKMFPNGETLIDNVEVLSFVNTYHNTIEFKYESDGDLIHLMLVKKYLDNQDIVASLIIYYMPYSRMDRSENGSVFTLKYISEFINDLNFLKVTIIEPHSDVTPALVNKSDSLYINFDLLPKVIDEINFDIEEDYIMFPDQGAARRYKSMKFKNELIGHKHRDFQTGKIQGLEVVGSAIYNPNKVIIVDDLSSFGGTFLYSGNVLKELGFKEIYLLVAHAENSIFKGDLLKEGSPITKIFATDSILSEDKRHDKLKVFHLKEVMKLND